jgi:hypothetical protein
MSHPEDDGYVVCEMNASSSVIQDDIDAAAEAGSSKMGRRFLDAVVARTARDRATRLVPGRRRLAGTASVAGPLWAGTEPKRAALTAILRERRRAAREPQPRHHGGSPLVEGGHVEFGR